MFYQLSPATQQFYEARSKSIFELPGRRSLIEIHVQDLLQDPTPQGSYQQDDTSYHSDDKTVCGSRPVSEPSSPTSLIELRKDAPSSYEEPPGLPSRKVYNVGELEKFDVASKDCTRFCFIRQRHSYSRLHVTRDLFDALMVKFDIFPRLQEFILLFGAKHGENELSPPQLRFRRLASNNLQGSGLEQDGFECAYGLRYVDFHNRDAKRPWSIRQTVIYHKYEAKSNSSTWVLISASKKTEEILDSYMGGCGGYASVNPFEIHLLILDTALTNWRRYIVDLTDKIRKQSDRVLVASIDERDPARLLGVEERQNLKEIEDDIIDILSVLDATADTIQSLLGKYRQFRRDIRSGLENLFGDGIDSIECALQERQKDVHMNRQKVEKLHAKVQGTTNLLSSLLDLGSGNSLHHLTEKGTQDAAAVKVLTIITLIYLPATVVSNFFSTQFVSQKQNDINGTFLVVCSNAWLFAAISIPLTLGTLAIWWLWVRFQVRRIRPLARSINFASLKMLLTPRRKIPRSLELESGLMRSRR
ncbi:hypothetical protein ABVK25_010526 [Lepraria finkii]|uniref:CorA-like transporter domain-containing protein n=1 Tax=Lepraria finkii TaxID=1340010 RepID=A0ABR4AWH7_9LECA